MRKGFLYTLFGLFFLALISLIVVSPVDIEPVESSPEKVSVDELFYFTESVKDDTDRAVSISSRRSLVAVTSHVLNGGNLTDPETATALAFFNGTVNGSVSSIMSESSLKDWISKMESQAVSSGYLINMSTGVSNITVEMVDPFKVRFRTEYSLSISDPNIETSFTDNNHQSDLKTSITGLDDALIFLQSGGKRSNAYSKCTLSHTSLKQSGTDSEYNYTDDDGNERNWVSGDSVVRKSNSTSGIGSKSEKILITTHLCPPDKSELDDFAGVVSNQTTAGQNVCGSEEEIPAYIGGISNVSAFNNETRLVMNQNDVWRNSIPDQIDSRCYFEDSTGPNFFDRLNRKVNGTSHGIASFLNVPNLPPEIQKDDTSAVDYVYFDEGGDYGKTWKIKGVTDQDLSWFRLDDTHVNRWGISDLAYE